MLGFTGEPFEVASQEKAWLEGRLREMSHVLNGETWGLEYQTANIAHVEGDTAEIFWCPCETVWGVVTDDWGTARGVASAYWEGLV